MVMENKNMIWNNSMYFGAVLGGILVVLSLIGYLFNVSNATILQILNYLALGFFLYYGTKVLRDKYQQGYITYGRALASGFLISLFAGIIVSFFVLIYLKWLDPAVLDTMKMQSQKIMIEKGYPQEQIDLSLKYMTPNIFAIGTIFSFSFWGFLLSLIAAFLVKRDQNPLEKVTIIDENKDENSDLNNNASTEKPELKQGDSEEQ
jgi:hypothetical protein